MDVDLAEQAGDVGVDAVYAHLLPGEIIVGRKRLRHGVLVGAGDGDAAQAAAVELLAQVAEDLFLNGGRKVYALLIFGIGPPSGARLVEGLERGDGHPPVVVRELDDGGQVAGEVAPVPQLQRAARRALRAG